MGEKRDKIIGVLSSKRAVRIFWIVVLLPFVVLFTLLGFTAAGVFGKLPSFEELENPKSNLATEIYSEDGRMIGSFFVQNRSYADYGELNDSLVMALVSTEDMRYYSHSGIDFISLGRVAFKTVALGDRGQGGGSTITQQLAKNLFPRDTTVYRNSFSRNGKLAISKLKEWITAVKLEYNYTKEEIIAMYLNTVAYGSNAYGIKSAAQTFFGKTPAELTVNESALLVGVVNAPTRYSPIRNPENAANRRNTVLARMAEVGFLTREQKDSLQKLPIELNYSPISHNQGTGTYFRGMLSSVMTMPKPKRNRFYTDWDYQQELKRWEENPLYGWCEKNTKADGTPYNIYRDGLKIYTTINSSMQRYAEEAIQVRMENDIQPALNSQIKSVKSVFYRKSKEDVDNIVRRAMRYSDRYRALKNEGASDADIDKSFDTPVAMKIFTYKGDVDTVMTPRDSIIHHKSIMRASFMAMDPHTGHVKAYVGGPSYKYFKYDMVKQGKRQVGSTIKPFVYAFAIDQLGLTPCTMVPNVDVTIETENGKPWQPKEAGGNTARLRDGSLKPLRWGLALSRNNYSAWIMKQAKQPKAVADFIHKMGVTSYIDPVYALCLGTPEVTLEEMVGSYATFVNKGIHTEPIYVTKILDRHGNLLASFQPTTSDAISSQTAYTMVGMLKNVVNSGTASGVRRWGITAELGGKTGTTDENRDAWYMGIAPNLVAGTWVGGEDQSVHLIYRGEGSALAMPVYAEFMKRVYADPVLGIKQTDTFPIPSGAVVYDCSKEAENADTLQAEQDDEFFN